MFENIAEDAARMGIDLENSNHFRMFDNTNYYVCATYPSKFIVPKQMKDEQVIACSKFRTKNRLPSLSYYHKKTGCSMWRSSQCMNGLMNNRAMEDEMMIQEMGKTANNNKNLINNSRVIIYDARPKLNAQANKYIKNGGYEDLRYYRNCDIIFCDIDNIHEVSKCFKNLYEIMTSPDNFNSIASYGPLLDSSGYLQMLSKILKATNMVVETLI